MRWGAFILVLGVESAGMAQGRDPATAEALFRAGRDSIKKRDFATACGQFAESQKLDPAGGTALNLAQCEQELGRTASSWQHAREALDLLPPDDDRVPLAREVLDRMERRVPRLVVRFEAGVPSGAHIVRDDVELGAAAIGFAQPVDPGSHKLTVVAPGRKDRTFEVAVAEGETREIDVRAGDPVPRLERTVVQLRSPFTPLRVAGIAVGGLGVVSLALGTVLGVVAKSTYDNAALRCGPNGCKADAVADSQTAYVMGDASTVLFIAGGVAVAAGITMFVLGAPKKTTTAFDPHLLAW